MTGTLRRLFNWCLEIRAILQTSQKGKTRYHNIKSAQRKELLTRDGLEHYYKQLLVDEGLLVDKQTLELGETYLQWKRKVVSSQSFKLKLSLKSHT